MILKEQRVGVHKKGHELKQRLAEEVLRAKARKSLKAQENDKLNVLKEAQICSNWQK